MPELSVEDKKAGGLLDVDEANFDRHIENKTDTMESKNALESERKKQQRSELTLAKDDYQLYEALMMLKGVHAVR